MPLFSMNPIKPTLPKVKSTVVNVKVASLRAGHRYNNISEWLADTDNVYIGRQARINVNGTYIGIRRSPWANEFSVKNYGRDGAIAKYRLDLETKLAQNPKLVTELLTLQGKNLGCWCAPDPCHGHVLLELIDKYNKAPT